MLGGRTSQGVKSDASPPSTSFALSHWTAEMLGGPAPMSDMPSASRSTLNGARWRNGPRSPDEIGPRMSPNQA